MVDDAYTSEGKIVIGVDEVGRGCLAGPVTVAAVAVRRGQHVEGAKDSKALSEKKRTSLAEKIRSELPYKVVSRSPKDIDRMNILAATLDAMREAVEDLSAALLQQGEKVIALVDGNRAIPNLSIPQECVIKGDSRSHAIACASIVAKDARDALMKSLMDDDIYGFARHKGYGTRQHYEALDAHGPSEHHRRSFRLTGGYSNKT